MNNTSNWEVGTISDWAKYNKMCILQDTTWKGRGTWSIPDESNLDGDSCELYVASSCEAKEAILAELIKPIPFWINIKKKLYQFYIHKIKEHLCFHNFNYRRSGADGLEKVCSKCWKSEKIWQQVKRITT